VHSTVSSALSAPYAMGAVELPEERAHVGPEYPVPWEADTLAGAQRVGGMNHHARTRVLEEGVATWRGQDPEHWPLRRLMLIDPWQETPGQGQADTPLPAKAAALAASPQLIERRS
jgi:hypothetical protein